MYIQPTVNIHMTTGEGGPVFSKAKHPNQSDYIQPLVKI
jgi:hypothetical protein